jgi:hypothetical protein
MAETSDLVEGMDAGADDFISKPIGSDSATEPNLFAMNAHQVCLYLLDVSGHGVTPAMLSVTLSSHLTADASHGNPLRRYDRGRGTFDPLSPGDAIRELNRRFQSKDDHYFTMIYGLFDSRSSVLSLAQAGHPSPILMRKECILEGRNSQPLNELLAGLLGEIKTWPGSQEAADDLSPMAMGITWGCIGSSTCSRSTHNR